MIKYYLNIIKPGIIFGNFTSIVGGFLLASKGSVNYVLLFATSIGVSLIIASSCIFNNYIDRDLDQKMKRTQNRILLKGGFSLKIILICAVILAIVGFLLLYLETNLLVITLGALGFIIYVVIYSLYIKRKSIYSTFIGSLSGAIPPITGYCAVSNQFDDCALILLIIFSLWQIPHSYAIAILNLKDYDIADIPILPKKYGILTTKHCIILFIVAFMAAIIMLMINGYVGYKYLIIMTLISIYWLLEAINGYKLNDNNTFWAHKMFICSIIVITLLNIMISIDFIG